MLLCLWSRRLLLPSRQSVVRCRNGSGRNWNSTVRWFRPFKVSAAKTQAPRQWTYATGSHKVFLMLQPDSKGSTLTGQVVAGSSKSDSASCLVELIRGKKVVASGSTNENGEFYIVARPGKVRSPDPRRPGIHPDPPPP